MESVGKAFVERLGNSPSHQQVGKNGSFWLPPKAKNEVFSKKLKAADSKLSEMKLTKKELKGEPKESTQNKARQPVQTKADLISKTGYPDKNNHESRIQIPEMGASTKKVFSGKKVWMQPPVITNVDRPLINQSQLLPVNKSNTSNLRDPGFQSIIHKNEVNPDADRDVHDNGRKLSHGIKSAYSDDDMEVIFKTQLTLELAGREITALSCRESNPQTRSFLEFSGKELLPRIAYFAKQDKRVVRFAMDFPNGSKLGVRLEKSKNSLSVCFISSDDHSQTILQELKAIINKFSEGRSGSGELKVFHFQNYKEMDNYFHQAA
ncbi:MAG: hypothetical protein CBC00_09850 [Verrucomicrobia bacterium TMED40]|nr:MAG: hypothetical protein CBC00_09850 [Verrucomicrobia bacterium TMED40]|tara:strand:- start:12 stop:974 length:963 start_codon:yes stop_codon:yes gene_type:complete